MLDEKDMAIFLALIENPIGTDKEIQQLIKEKTEQRVDISIPTIHRRIKKMLQKQIVHGAVPDIQYPFLNMELHSFLIEINPKIWENSVSTLDTFFDAHPYTLYQNRVFGANNGIFCQFSLPQQEGIAFTKLTKIFDLFIERGYIEKYIHFPKQGKTITNNTNLGNWNVKTNEWRVDYSKIDDQMSQDFGLYKPDPIENRNYLQDMQMIDFIILREMTRNARRSQRDMLKFAKDSKHGGIYQDYFEDPRNPDSKQTFSRRYNYLIDKGIVTNFELAYDRMIFGVFNHALYIGEYDAEAIAGLHQIIKNGQIPFHCKMSFTPNHFLFWINLPPIDLIHFPEVMMKKFNQLQVYFFGRFPKRYYFYHKNFNENEQRWNISEDWLVNKPLNKIDL